MGTAFGFTDSTIPWSLDGGCTQYATFANPWPSGLDLPAGPECLCFLGMDAGTPLPKDENPQYQQWNFSVQREVPGHGVVEVNYVGTKGTHLYLRRHGRRRVANSNNARPRSTGAWAGTRSTRWCRIRSTESSPIPRPRRYNQPTIQLNRLLRPYRGVLQRGRLPRLAEHRQLHLPRAAVKYEKRFSRGLSVIAHYTFSKMISDSDESGSRCELHRGRFEHPGLLQSSQRAFALGVRPCRSGWWSASTTSCRSAANRAFGKGMNRILDGVIGGWELSAIISASSRTPLRITQSASNLWNGAASVRTWSAIPSMPGSVRDKLNNYFNVNAFTTSDRTSDRLHSTLPLDLPRTGPRERGCHPDEELQHQGTEVRAVAAGGLQRDEHSAVGRRPTRASAAPASARSPAPTGNRSVQVAGKFYF